MGTSENEKECLYFVVVIFCRFDNLKTVYHQAINAIPKLLYVLTVAPLQLRNLILIAISYIYFSLDIVCK